MAISIKELFTLSELDAHAISFAKCVTGCQSTLRTV